MKARWAISILLLFLWGITQNSFSQSSSIDEVWVTSADNGYYIHSKINITGMKGKKTKVLATFYDKDKKAMKGVKQGYLNIANGACASYTDTPNFDKTLFNDFQIFVPNDALSLETGLNTYYVRVSVYDVDNKKFISNSSNYISFQAYKDNTLSSATTNPRNIQNTKDRQSAKSDNSYNPRFRSTLV